MEAKWEAIGIAQRVDGGVLASVPNLGCNGFGNMPQLVRITTAVECDWIKNHDPGAFVSGCGIYQPRIARFCPDCGGKVRVE